jgi:hypothetical protein
MTNREERYPGYNENNVTDVSINEIKNVRYKLVNVKENNKDDNGFCSVCTEETRKECPFCNVERISHEKETLEVMRKDIKREVKKTIVDLTKVNSKPNVVEKYEDNMVGGEHKVQIITSESATINQEADVVIIFNKKSGVINLPAINGESKLDDKTLMLGKMIVIKVFGSSQVIKVQNGEKIIDGGVNSFKIEGGGKKNLLIVGKNWITI